MGPVGDGHPPEVLARDAVFVHDPRGEHGDPGSGRQQAVRRGPRVLDLLRGRPRGAVLHARAEPPDVPRLLQKNPFGNTPPKYVRALLYNYRFTDFGQRRATGEWWHREPKGLRVRI